MLRCTTDIKYQTVCPNFPFALEYSTESYQTDRICSMSLSRDTTTPLFKFYIGLYAITIHTPLYLE